MIKPSGDGTSSGAPMLDCFDAVNKLWDYLDGNLSEADREAVRQHVEMCAHCFPHAAFGQVVLDAVAQARSAQGRYALSDSTSIRDRVIASLRAEGYDGP